MFNKSFTQFNISWRELWVDLVLDKLRLRPETYCYQWKCQHLGYACTKMLFMHIYMTSRMNVVCIWYIQLVVTTSHWCPVEYRYTYRSSCCNRK